MLRSRPFEHDLLLPGAATGTTGIVLRLFVGTMIGARVMPLILLVGRCTNHAIPTDTVAFSLVVKKGSRSRWPRLCPFAASSRFGIGVHFKISAGKMKEVCLPCAHVWYGTREQEANAVGFLASQ